MRSGSEMLGRLLVGGGGGGGAAATFTVAVAVLDPPSLRADSVYVVELLGNTVRLPFACTAPTAGAITGAAAVVGGGAVFVFDGGGGGGGGGGVFFLQPAANNASRTPIQITPI